MNAHVIEFAKHQIITKASLIDLRGARRVALYVGDKGSASLFMTEITRRLVE